jgi:hypothetical protein
MHFTLRAWEPLEGDLTDFQPPMLEGIGLDFVANYVTLMSIDCGLFHFNACSMDYGPSKRESLWDWKGLS